MIGPTQIASHQKVVFKPGAKKNGGSRKLLSVHAAAASDGAAATAGDGPGD
jgi:hypothetical protein